MIARRKRMLQTFLNRIARHPILSNEHVFHRFLDGEVSWVRVVTARLTLKLTEADGSPKFTTPYTPAEEHPQGSLAQPNGSKCCLGL